MHEAAGKEKKLDEFSSSFSFFPLSGSLGQFVKREKERVRKSLEVQAQPASQPATFGRLNADI